jgi:hypothetical protein
MQAFAKNYLALPRGFRAKMYKSHASFDGTELTYNTIHPTHNSHISQHTAAQCNRSRDTLYQWGKLKMGDTNGVDKEGADGGDEGEKAASVSKPKIKREQGGPLMMKISRNFHALMFDVFSG